MNVEDRLEQVTTGRVVQLRLSDGVVFLLEQGQYGFFRASRVRELGRRVDHGVAEVVQERWAAELAEQLGLAAAGLPVAAVGVGLPVAAAAGVGLPLAVAAGLEQLLGEQLPEVVEPMRRPLELLLVEGRLPLEPSPLQLDRSPLPVEKLGSGSSTGLRCPTRRKRRGKSARLETPMSERETKF